MIEKEFFAKITRLQQKGSVDEYTYEWEALETWVPELATEQRLQTYIHGLKQYIQDELDMNNITTMEKEIRKENIVEKKFKRTSQANFDKVHLGCA